MDTRLSKNFRQSELECECGCHAYIPNSELVDVLQDLRDHFKVPVRVTSSTRCVDHNKAIGGVKSSKHLLGLAADVQVAGVSPEVVYEYLDNLYPDKYGIGSYNSFTHIDVREHKARW